MDPRFTMLAERARGLGRAATNGNGSGDQPVPDQPVQETASWQEPLKFLKRVWQVTSTDLCLDVAGRQLRLEPLEEPHAPKFDQPMTVRVDAGGGEFRIVADLHALHLLLANLPVPAAAEQADPQDLAVALEFSLLDAVLGLEAKFGCALTIVSVSAGDCVPSGDGLWGRLTGLSEVAIGLKFGTASDAIANALLLEFLTADPSADSVMPNTQDPEEGRILAAVIDLPAEDVSKLTKDDQILLENELSSSLPAILTLPDGACWFAEVINQETIRITSTNAAQAKPGEGPSTPDLSELEPPVEDGFVRLSVDVGEAAVTMRDRRRMTAGYHVGFRQSRGRIIANGKVVGVGTIERQDNALVVKVK